LTAISFEDDLQLEENPWRGRIMTLLILAALAAVIAVATWYFFFRDESLTLTRETEEIPVTRGTINQRLSITGTADAELNSNLVFQTSGKVASVNVKIGDKVTQGQVLASLESEDVENAVASARANQLAAQLKVDDLLEGTDEAELAQAEQALTTAQAQQTKALNDYETLTGGGTASDLATAQQGVGAAEAQLATARANRQKLQDGASDADIAAAEAGVAQAESLLTSAENTADSANNGVTAASATLKSAESSYCIDDNTPSFCSVPAAPISSGDATIVTSALGGANATKASLVIGGNTGYLNALNTKASADANEQAAQDALASAEAKLDAANDGATAEDTTAVDAAVVSAEASLRAAQEKLLLVQNGGTEAQRSTAAAALVSADASVDAAVALFNKALRGADSNTLAQARQAVATAALQVEAAQIRLKNAQIIAPFTGTVGDVNIKVGEFSGGAAAASAEGGAPIVLLTPERLTLTMSVGETDYRTVKIGQAGVALFDGIPGGIYPFTITEIGLSPVVTQGVVTYNVKASLVVLPDGVPPVPGMNARGQITTSSVENVLIIPARAIRISGTNQVVDRKAEDGSIEEVVVTTGANDGEQVEIASGLEDGNTIVVVTLTSGETGSTPEAEPTLPGGVR
jgi:multidrug efflux pump subunit AcrA (membrane-fusion protein)